jgi:hypothetical protein
LPRIVGIKKESMGSWAAHVAEMRGQTYREFLLRIPFLSGHLEGRGEDEKIILRQIVVKQVMSTEGE